MASNSSELAPFAVPRPSSRVKTTGLKVSISFINRTITLDAKVKNKFVTDELATVYKRSACT